MFIILNFKLRHTQLLNSKILYDMPLALRKPTDSRPKNINVSCNVHTHIWYLGCYENSYVCKPNVQTKIYWDGQVIMYQQSCPSRVFWLLQSSLSFCVPTYWMLVLRWRSAILHDNRCPVMCEVRGMWWMKYITIINIGELKWPRQHRRYLKHIHIKFI